MITKVKFCAPFEPILQVFRGPPVLQSDDLRVRGNFFGFQGSMEQKRLRATALECHVLFEWLL